MFFFLTFFFCLQLLIIIIISSVSLCAAVGGQAPAPQPPREAFMALPPLSGIFAGGELRALRGQAVHEHAMSARTHTEEHRCDPPAGTLHVLARCSALSACPFFCPGTSRAFP